MLCAVTSNCELRTVICGGYYSFCELRVNRTKRLLSSKVFPCRICTYGIVETCCWGEPLQKFWPLVMCKDMVSGVVWEVLRRLCNQRCRAETCNNTSLRLRKRTVRFRQKRRKENVVDRGNKGDRQLPTANEMNSQVGVTHCGGTFTGPVAQICHPYDHGSFATRSAPVGPSMCTGPAVTPGGVEPPFECACAAEHVMYYIGPRHDRWGNALHMASSCH